MKKFLLTAVFLAMPAYADMIGSIDNRRHAEWDSEEYGAMVKIGSNTGPLCSGAYVSPNIILTARHCVAGSPLCGRDSCRTTNSKGKTFDAWIVMVGGSADRKAPMGTLNRDDWAFLAAPSPEFYSEHYYPIYPGMQRTFAPDMTSAGFGSLRLLANSDIPVIKYLYVEYLRGEVIRLGNDRIRDLGSSTLFVANTIRGFDDFLAARLYETGISPLFTDAGKLKVHEGCMISNFAPGSDGLYLVNHTCDNAGGDSGGPIIDPYRRVNGVMSRGRDSLNACPPHSSSANCAEKPLIAGEAETQATRVDLFNAESRKLIR